MQAGKKVVQRYLIEIQSIQIHIYEGWYKDANPNECDDMLNKHVQICPNNPLFANPSHAPPYAIAPHNTTLERRNAMVLGS